MDGKMVPWHEANVHVLTHTLHYGFGVFEGIRCYYSKENGSAIFRLQDHINRLFQSAVILGIEVPFSNKDIVDATIKVVCENKLEECYIRPIIFLGDNKMRETSFYYWIHILPHLNKLNIVPLECQRRNNVTY